MTESIDQKAVGEIKTAEGRIIHYPEFPERYLLLRKGDVIDSISTLADLDNCMDLIVYHKRGARETFDDYLGGHGHVCTISDEKGKGGGKLVSELLREQVGKHVVKIGRRKLKFHGDIRNFTVTVIPFEDGRTSAEDNLLIEGELHSTGRGRIGTTAREVVVSSNKITSSHPVKESSTGRSIASVERVSEQRSFEARQAAEINVVSGGLPTLGKRK